jgi:hypothetical protein
MNQKPIIIYLRMKGIALDAIHDDLVRALGKDAVAYSMVIKYAHRAQFCGRKEATPPEAPDVERSPVDEAMYQRLFTCNGMRSPSALLIMVHFIPILRTN